jgi:hypothetical protein
VGDCVEAESGKTLKVVRVIHAERPARGPGGEKDWTTRAIPENRTVEVTMTAKERVLAVYPDASCIRISGKDDPARGIQSTFI